MGEEARIGTDYDAQPKCGSMKTHLFLERTFPAPLSIADVHAAARHIEWCFETHRVDWNSSFLSLDGQRMVCWFTAPDMESVRVTLQHGGADMRVLWRGTVHEGREAADANVLVERSFDQPVSLEQIQSIEDRAAWCLEAHRVKFARTFFSADRRRMLCLYEAPDAESVRIAQRKAGMPFQAVWAFRRIGLDTMLASASG